MEGIDFHLARETVMIWSHFWIILSVGVVCDVAFWFAAGAITRKVGGEDKDDRITRLAITGIMLLATVLFALLGSVSTTTTITWKG